MTFSCMTRRGVMGAGLGSLALAASIDATAHTASAQTNGHLGQPPIARFGYADVVRRAKDIAAIPFEVNIPPLPAPFATLDFDAWRDIRFRADKALFQSTNSPFQLQLFHLGFNFKRPVTVNVVRDGMPAPIPYSSSLFDYGRTKIDKPLPVNTGFAGFRLHYPVNEPKVMDELIAFLGASYFRFLGRVSSTGMLGARPGRQSSGVGRNEEFPFFREFWMDQPVAGADQPPSSPCSTGIRHRRLPVRWSIPASRRRSRRKSHCSPAANSPISVSRR